MTSTPIFSKIIGATPLVSHKCIFHPHNAPNYGFAPTFSKIFEGHAITRECPYPEPLGVSTSQLLILVSKLQNYKLATSIKALKKGS